MQPTPPKLPVMLDRETTIQGLFRSTDVTFCIPPYQRAYAWETVKDRKQVVQFLDDLEEHPPSEGLKKCYFLGHLLFERESPESSEILVIDGQQRLTTVVIFFHCMSRELAARQKTGERLLKADGCEIDLGSLRRSYVMGEDSRRKVKIVDYDDELFRSLIKHDSTPTQPTTRSGVRLQEAIEYMAKRMKEETSTAELIRWLQLVETAVVTTFEVTSKEQATQIFAFQNDRGKDLTNLEKLKAQLMRLVYMHSPTGLEREFIKAVEGKFAEIYKLAEVIEKLNEDQVLGHHLTAFLPQMENPAASLKEELLKRGRGLELVEWIRTDFCAKLVQSFRNVLELERLMKGSARHERLIGDVLYLNPWASWPLLLKLMHFHAVEIHRTEAVLRLMEITMFKLEFMKGKSTNRMPNIANRYTGNLEVLLGELQHVSQRGFWDHWDFNGEFQRFLDGSYHYNSLTRYLLWKYENDRRAEERGAHHPLLLQEYVNETEGQNLDGSIEHILPRAQVPSLEFEKDYLHNLGNLVLMTKGWNSSLKDKLPLEKARCLEFKTLYLSQQAVVKTILERRTWGEKEIIERKRLIVDFALHYWQAERQAPAQAEQL